MAKVVCICTYPVAVPRHGGQIRVSAIQRVYQEAGHEVRHMAVYRSDHYETEPASPWNIHFTPSFVDHLLNVAAREDVYTSDFPLTDNDAYGRMLKLLRDFEPDVIQLEHCWMWPALKDLRNKNLELRKVKLIYSSQNVEHELLRSASSKQGAKDSKNIVDLVRLMEMDLVSNADLVVTCSSADSDVFRPFSKNIVLASNGIWPKALPTGDEYWRKAMSGRQLALFVGSAHPPNAAGFLAMLGPHLGFLSPSERIIVVGGVCRLLPIEPLFREHHGLNLARCMLAGIQDPGGLSTLISLADVIIVPIVEGGGTNIKMAEAIYHRKPIICTTKATRGYEAFLDSPLIMVRDTPEDFRSTLADVLRHKVRPDNPTRAQVERLPNLLWSSTLLPLVQKLNDLVSHTALPRGGALVQGPDHEECQKSGALGRELGGALAEAEAAVQHRGPDLEHAVRAQG